LKNHIKPFLGSIRLDKLTPLKIQEYYNKKEGKLSKTTINYHHILRSAFKLEFNPKQHKPEDLPIK